MVAFILTRLLVSSSGAGFLPISLIAAGVIVGVVLVRLGSFVLWRLLFCPWVFSVCSKSRNVGVILSLQSSSAIHLGVDNLGVVRYVGRLLDGRHGPTPFELVNDGDLLLLVERMLHLRGLDTVRITKVKGLADEGMVLDSRVREVDRIGNDAADEAADFGRRRVGNAVIDARRNLSGVCGRWYPVLLDIHRFFVAISRAVVNHDGRDGTAPDPLVYLGFGMGYYSCFCYLC